MLQQCLSLQHVDDTILQFPSKIEDLYANTLKRIYEGDAALPRLLLVWLINIRGNLSIEDLQCAAAVCPKTYQFEDNRIVAEADLVSACCGLITVEYTTRQVRLIREYRVI